jgi:transcriptional regulator with XRE-family HTH domain
MNTTRIPDLRQELAWTQERLAVESGVGIRTIQRIESGNDASLETLSLLADALRVPVRDLFAEIEDPDLSSRVESLENRTRQQQAERNRVTSGYRWLFIGVGVVVTIVSPVFGGWGGAIILAYWGGGILILMALRKLFLDPMFEQRFPLSRSKRELRENKRPLT